MFVAIYLKSFGACMNILFIIKVKIFVLTHGHILLPNHVDYWAKMANTCVISSKHMFFGVLSFTLNLVPLKYTCMLDLGMLTQPKPSRNLPQTLHFLSFIFLRHKAEKQCQDRGKTTRKHVVEEGRWDSSSVPHCRIKKNQVIITDLFQSQFQMIYRSLVAHALSKSFK